MNVHFDVSIVIKPPPPMPVNALMALRNKMFVASEHPKQPVAKVMADTKKQARRPKISE